MICPKCFGNKTRANVKISITVNADDAPCITKKLIAKATTLLVSAQHDQTTYFCMDCFHAWGGAYETLKEEAAK